MLDDAIASLSEAEKNALLKTTLRPDGRT